MIAELPDYHPQIPTDLEQLEHATYAKVVGNIAVRPLDAAQPQLCNFTVHTYSIITKLEKRYDVVFAPIEVAMCVNFRPPDPEMLNAVMGVIIDLHDTGFWKTETWKDYPAPIVRRGADGGREGVLATYGMVPRQKIPAGVRSFDTMNARTETVGQLRSFSGAWKRTQLCLVPMTAFYEPCYESGKPVRWGIGMADESMFAVAGLWREWDTEAGPAASFTQLTMNADDHPLMKRFHKPGDEKRALVVVPQAEWDDWLGCSDPEYARSFIRTYPAELMRSWEFPVPPRAKKVSAPAPDNMQLEL